MPGPVEAQTLPRIGDFVPEIDAQKCLLANSAFSKCRACADACPADAIICDGEGIGIAEENCIGCALCVPACPETAIPAPFSPRLRQTSDGRAVFLACHIALGDQPSADDERDTVPCLHRLGLAELEAIRHKGADLIVFSCGDCAKCLPAAGRRLSETVNLYRDMLTSRNLAAPTIGTLPSQDWQALRAGSQACSPGRVVGRRGFLRMFSEPVASKAAAEPQMTGAYGLPVVSAQDIVAHRPVIDTETCSGCDACIKVCPHGALTRGEVGEAGEDSYVIAASACTGCRLCVDVCADSAIALAGPGVSEQEALPLSSFRCRRCGVPFHLPGDRPEQELCRVCGRVDQRQRLFQVQA